MNAQIFNIALKKVVLAEAFCFVLSMAEWRQKGRARVNEILYIGNSNVGTIKAS